MNRALRIKVDTFVTSLTSIRLHHFYLETIQDGIKEPVESFSEYLFQLVEYGDLCLKYELRCPEYDCGCKIVFDKYSEIPFGDFIEDYKGHEILVEEENIVPYFIISEEIKSSREEAIAEKKDVARLANDIKNCKAVLKQDNFFHNPISKIPEKWPITYLYINHHEGDILMSGNETIKQISNGNSGNLNQSIGDNTKNTITQSFDDHNNLFAEAKEAISSTGLTDSEKEDAIIMIETAEEKYNSGFKERGLSFLKVLPDVVKAIPSVVSLLQLFQQ